MSLGVLKKTVESVKKNVFNLFSGVVAKCLEKDIFMK